MSGYSFNSRDDIAGFIEHENSPFLREIMGLAKEFRCYIILGLAFCDAQTNIFFNTAFVAGPSGLICKYHKINAELRWACPGGAKQKNIFTTPWGKLGVLICSDSYHELIPRVAVINGANLLLVLANWPPTGLNPIEIWQARAMENGCMIAVCNRTGMDKKMDCRKAESCLIDTDGTVLSDCSSSKSKLFKVSVPLTNNSD